MKATVPLGRWFGVPVGLHYSWFLIAWLVTLSLSAQFSALDPGWAPVVVWTLSIATALLFFISIVLHELAHATVARMSGVPVRGIMLFALGGVAELAREAATAGKELAIAIAGPIASVVIGGLCLAIAGRGGAASPEPLPAMLGWLGYINVSLAVFNLIPGYPLDGGRVLRAIVWRVTGNVDKATRIAARTGMAFGLVFIAMGLLRVLGSGDLSGLWMAMVGWFLLEVARGQYALTLINAGLRDVRVADVMAHECDVVDADLTVDRFVQEHLLRAPDRCFAVRRDGDIVGIVSPADVQAIDKAHWPERPVADAMRPLDAGHTLPPDAPASAALSLMARDRVNQVPIVAHGHFEGVITQAQLLQLLQLRAELR